MSKRYQHLIRRQAKIKVIAHTNNTHNVSLIWLATLGAAVFAFVFYLFSLFFSGIEWRALTEP